MHGEVFGNLNSKLVLEMGRGSATHVMSVGLKRERVFAYVVGGLPNALRVW